MAPLDKRMKISATRAPRNHAPIAMTLCTGIVAVALALPRACAAAGEYAAYDGHAIRAGSALQEAAPSQAAIEANSASAAHRHFADFGRERPSTDARQIADWVVDSTDNRGLPFVVADKIDAKVFVFDASGRILGAAPALFGAAKGDYSVPGIGDRPLSDQPRKTRITPAGRFVAALGIDSHGHGVVWVDYRAAVALHRVITTNPKEHRLERLATPTPSDNRISWGCINVPVRFYDTVVKPAFTGAGGIVYVLPETSQPLKFFGAYDVGERLRRRFADRAQAMR
jgi:hypothetical protein